MADKYQVTPKELAMALAKQPKGCGRYGGLTAAIIAYRDRTGTSLVEAKKAVEEAVYQWSITNTGC